MERNKQTIYNLLIDTYKLNFKLNGSSAEEVVLEKMKQLSELLPINKAELIGAFKDDKLVGFVWIYVKEYFGEKRLHINHIVVDGSYRGNNIGNMLMQKVEDVAREQNISLIDLIVSNENVSAMKLYEKNGYTIERSHLIKSIGELDVKSNSN